MARAKIGVKSIASVREAKLNEKLVAKGIQSFLACLLVHNTRKQKLAIQLFEKTFEDMKEFREQMQDDKERLTIEAKQKREIEAEWLQEQLQNERDAMEEEKVSNDSNQ